MLRPAVPVVGGASCGGKIRQRSYADDHLIMHAGNTWILGGAGCLQTICHTSLQQLFMATCPHQPQARPHAAALLLQAFYWVLFRLVVLPEVSRGVHT